MTRLITEWIFQMDSTVADWNVQLKNKTGLDFIMLAEIVGNVNENTIIENAVNSKVAVVPITSGLGTISSFAESVAAIIRTMGFNTYVTENTDVNGIYEANQNGADIIYMADDDRYIAINLKNNKIGENNIATAKGYVEILDSMASGLKNKSVAVLGYGIIGKLMAGFLEEKGARVAIYDKDPEKIQEISDAGYECIYDITQLLRYNYVADGTSEGNWLDESMLSPNVKIAAPGVPLSLTESAQVALQGNYVHDVLEIGTAGMLGMVI